MSSKVLKKPIELIESSIQELEFFRVYIDDIEEQNIARLSKLEDPKNIITSEYNVMDRTSIKIVEGLNEKHIDLSRLFEVEFPNIQRYSALISIFIFLENVLNKLCISLQENNKLSFKDLAGKGIDRAKNYLDKVIGINFNQVFENWKNLKDIQNIRNIISHKNGEVNDISSEMQKFIDKRGCNEIEIISNSKIYLKKHFLNYVINEVYRLFWFFQNNLHK